MAVIIGRCEHGIIVSAAIEASSTPESLEDMACSYTLERVEIVNLGGPCEPCHDRYVANMKLLGLPV